MAEILVNVYIELQRRTVCGYQLIDIWRTGTEETIQEQNRTEL